jgi:hypothetical protein
VRELQRQLKAKGVSLTTERRKHGRAGELRNGGSGREPDPGRPAPLVRSRSAPRELRKLPKLVAADEWAAGFLAEPRATAGRRRPQGGWRVATGTPDSAVSPG